MINNELRVGRFTSSQIHRLTTNGRGKGEIGKPFYTYVDEKVQEAKLGRSLSLNKGSRSTAWGDLMEIYFSFNICKTKWKHKGKDTAVHPDFDRWAGTPDLLSIDAVADNKSFEPTNFCKLADAIDAGLEVFKREYKAEYWQLISNSCIFKRDKCEIILFMPYQSELEKIREWISEDKNIEEHDLWKYRYIFDSPDNELPYVPDDCKYYQNIHSLLFEAPKEDQEFLTERVTLAQEMLKAKLS